MKHTKRWGNDPNTPREFAFTAPPGGWVDGHEYEIIFTAEKGVLGWSVTSSKMTLKTRNNNTPPPGGSDGTIEPGSDTDPPFFVEWGEGELEPGN